MGAAAYNRGTAAIRAQLDAAAQPPEMVLFNDLLAEALKHRGAVPFQATVVRFGPSDGEVSIMNREAGGWGQRSYTYSSLWALVREWSVAFVGAGEDEHGRFLRVVPAPWVKL
jgi:hypothetical protein